MNGANEWTKYEDRAGRLFKVEPGFKFATAPSFEDMKKACQEVLRCRGRNVAKGVLLSFGYEKVYDVSPWHYADIIKQCEETLKDTPMPEKTVIQEASDIIDGARHGAPERSFDAIAGLWNVYLGAAAQRAGTTFTPLAPYQVADMMELLKIARAATGDPTHRDHYVDRIGYAALAHELLP